jgi:hypothetical protein
LNKIEKISAELNVLEADVRAEAAVAQCIEKSLLQKELMVQQDAFFYRTHVHDIYSVQVNGDNPYRQLLAVHLSRPGLYDSLPEGLFFQSADGGRAAVTALEMAEEFRINKEKEKGTRKFFAPFEHEFFLHTLKNELVENSLLQGLKSGWLKEYFIDFWRLPENIPVNAALVMVMFLPYVHVLAGDLPHTAKVLEKILNEPVTMELQYKYDAASAVAYNVLGNFNLGSTLTCGESFLEQHPEVVVNIGALQKTTAWQYVQGNNYYTLLQTFYNYFIPASATVTTNILLQPAQQQLVLKNKGAESVLGMSSVI